KVEEAALAIPPAVLHHKVAVEQNGFDFGQRRVVPVEEGPARLDYPDLGVLEIGDGAAEKIGMRQEIGVENGNESARGGFHAFFEGAGLVALAVVAMQVNDVETQGLIALHAGAGRLDGLVG